MRPVWQHMAATHCREYGQTVRKNGQSADSLGGRQCRGHERERTPGGVVAVLGVVEAGEQKKERKIQSASRPTAPAGK